MLHHILIYSLILSFLLPAPLLAYAQESFAVPEQPPTNPIPIYFFLHHDTTTAYGIFGISPIADDTFAWAYAQIQADNGTATSSYGYDYQGNRVSQAVQGGLTTLYANKLYSTNGASTTKHIFAGNTLIATVEKVDNATTTHIIHTDHLGGAHVITDANGDVVQTVEYYPFGSIYANTRSTSLDEVRKYIGQYYDEDTELSYLNARYYDGSRGQFTSQDPVHLAIGSPDVEQLTGKRLQEVLADPQVLNSYSYARNNPIVYKDPEGKYLESGFDVAMLGISLYQFYQEPSWSNAGGVLLDAGSLALPGVPAFGGMALRAGKATDATYTVYQGFDAADDVRYVGITGRELSQRVAEHRRAIGSGRESLRYETIPGTGNLTQTQAKALYEQPIINQFGLQKNGGQLLNKINSVSPSSQLYKSVPSTPVGSSGGASLNSTLGALSSALQKLSSALSSLFKK